VIRRAWPLRGHNGEVKIQRFSEQTSQQGLPSSLSKHAGPMVGALWVGLWAMLGALAVVGVVKHRARIRAHTQGRRLDDHDVRRIIATGVYTFNVDEPTDLSRVEEEERRFWAQVQAAEGGEPEQEERAPWESGADAGEWDEGDES
jgi:hypothetical protein